MNNNDNLVKYSEYMVCYIDILGFKNIILDSTESILDIFVLLKLMKDIPEYDSQSSIKIIQFSDSIVFLAPFIDSDIEKNISILGDIVSRTHSVIELCAKYFKKLIRGGITIGKLYYEGSIIFGPALINAVDLEKEAKFPRVIFDNDVFLEKGINLDKFDTNNYHYKDDFITKDDDDQKFYIDYFPKKDCGDKNICMDMLVLHEIISLGLESLDLAILEKTKWVKANYNKSVNILKDLPYKSQFGAKDFTTLQLFL